LALAATACGDDDAGGVDAGGVDAPGVDAPGADTPERPDTGPCTLVADEGTPALCDDGCDNDGDGFTDCMDFGCEGVGACGVMTCDTEGPEDTTEACTDGCDNDRNGFADCDDFSCQALAVCPSEATNRTCSDGIDNDDNGFIDCADFSCMREDDGMLVGLAVCIRENSNAACSDGIDNDGDGDIDCDDDGCSMREHIVVCGEGAVTDPSLWEAAVRERCSDGINNDGDVSAMDVPFTDCGDFDCTGAFESDVCLDLPRETGNGRCSDGIDNDMDGLIDCDDGNCQGEAMVVCVDGEPVVLTDEEITAAANPLCEDGINNDESASDTRADCMDFDCSLDPLVTVCGEETGDEACSDGLDNDGDGFFDCADFSCNRSTFVTVCETTSELCDDNMDNDGNGFKDCNDRNCENTAACR
jgi:hypothetical protein